MSAHIDHVSVPQCVWLYQSESNTFLHMLEFSWCRGNSDPGTSCFLPLRDTELLPEGRLSYLVRCSLEREPSTRRLDAH